MAKIDLLEQKVVAWIRAYGKKHYPHSTWHATAPAEELLTKWSPSEVGRVMVEMLRECRDETALREGAADRPMRSLDPATIRATARQVEREWAESDSDDPYVLYDALVQAGAKAQRAPTPAREPVACNVCNEHRVLTSLCQNVSCPTHPPTPEAGTVTSDMALDAAREHAAQMGESFDAMWDQMDERERAEFVIDWSVILRKALAGRRGA